MDYKSTLNLPQTGFPMKANLPQREPEVLERWSRDNLYEAIIAKNKGRERFTLHDGPPYANGHIHLGHVLNKVLKDIVVRYRNLSGALAEYVPGWDCHGLPIELAVEKKLGRKRQGMTPADIRKACRAYAADFLAIQRTEFQRLGVAGAWNDPYLTMDFRYEATIAREIGRFALSGALYRAKMPVFWCASCATALAEAEVEYEEKTSPSIYVAFPVRQPSAALEPFAGRVKAAIWTTTPWTLVANLAIAVHPELEYVLIKGRRDDELLLVAKGLAERAAEGMRLPGLEVAATIPARELEGTVCRHPFVDRDSPILFGEYVTLDAGTGCVHTAPGHGQEDYVLGRAHGLEPYAPVDRRGRFTDEAGEFAGLRIEEANPRIVEKLDELGALLNPPGETIQHSYPHCWRCKKAVLFRATEQWFISLSHSDLRSRSLAEIDRVQWVPAWGRDRIYAMVENRPDWCVSRQRLWGVPIPALFCESCDTPLLTKEVFDGVVDLFAREGADAWFERAAQELVPAGATCECGHGTFRKEDDILDVWFDSGVSFAAVLEEKTRFGVPADLYLEGNDQHRGWFHSSLLAAVGTREKAPYRTVLTHGMVVDADGRKMSKSQGNNISPDETVKEMGAEILRLWVAAEDYREDIRVSKEILKNVSEGYRKIRNTARFLLSNLADFDPREHVPEDNAFDPLDRWALARLDALVERLRASYERYEFHKVYHDVLNFCAVDLSAFYLDIVKDRLYCSAADDPRRRAIQSTLYRLAHDLSIVCAPVLCFTADEIWRHLPEGARPQSVHLAEFPQAGEVARDARLDADVAALRAVRDKVNEILEVARRNKEIGKSLEAWITLRGGSPVLAAVLERHRASLAEIFIVSSVSLGEMPGADELDIAWQVAPGVRCERCWRHVEDVAAHGDEHPALCARCAQTLNLR